MLADQFEVGDRVKGVAAAKGPRADRREVGREGDREKRRVGEGMLADPDEAVGQGDRAQGVTACKGRRADRGEAV
eukprot:CAMPEP_0118830920 /NCGR_PEP_ID=MMETSP1162-20130426/28468_1 /TAXON_ID=33656 /ORGANISM="Phaeocystis Sp, Strain CCMP2710" /LENGTH=74 /DNA_ID=CAMNT_0006762291 /DNA_START=197 /DNA_END=418 /DNA_ORIENTATION=+